MLDTKGGGARIDAAFSLRSRWSSSLPSAGVVVTKHGQVGGSGIRCLGIWMSGGDGLNAILLLSSELVIRDPFGAA